MAAARSHSEMFSPMDAAWWHMEDPTSMTMITGVMTFDGPIDIERLKATLEQRFLTYRRFRQRVRAPRLGIGLPRWEMDPHFDLSSHIHRIALPSPGDQTALEELAGDLMSTPLDYSKPLWQLHIVENCADNKGAMIVRLHHCIADGLALVRVLPVAGRHRSGCAVAATARGDRAAARLDDPHLDAGGPGLHGGRACGRERRAASG